MFVMNLLSDFVVVLQWLVDCEVICNLIYDFVMSIDDQD